ncbi:substrate-binding periplasmic protein [Bdellovibrio reynosensis]|uniref:Transporter substrate-binding domain-containing protein n=1 Tax=Bdellovibrio reynosensis TaxID=2835041 RepID=A0ABY4CG61_9BACT|nr:transporter substrate-binding domain-containing protein [Bdellovibrio reynosensis]UOF02786.1 transporter substrate-binding domain-containing protein [Bdellovibrio reynosensis]
MNVAGRIIFLIIFVFCSFVSAKEIKAHVPEKLLLTTNYWCPYVCDPTSERPGYVIEVLRLIYSKKDIQPEFLVTSWARAMAEVKENRIAVLVAATAKSSQKLIRSRHAIGIQRMGFYTLADSNWLFRGIKSLEHKKVGIINGYSYGEALDMFIEYKNKSLIPISGEKPIEQILKMVESRRLDAVVEETLVLKDTMDKLGFPSTKLRFAGWVDTTNPMLYLAFSPDNPESARYLEIFETGISELRRTGELQRILKKYGTEDWEKIKFKSL